MKRSRNALIWAVLVGGPMLVVGDRLLLSGNGKAAATTALLTAGLAAATGGADAAPAVGVGELLSLMSASSQPDAAGVAALFTAANSALGVAPGPASAQATAAAGPRVTAIIRGSAHRAAVIDGTVRREGDRFNGYTVLAIEDRSVILDHQGERHAITMAVIGP